MNEQAFKDAFRLFVENGYADREEDFRKLISENPEALNDSYKLFKANGYADGIDDFKSLIGVEAPKQEEPGFFEGLFGSDKESTNTVSNTMMGKVGAYEPEVKKKAASTVSPSGESSSVLPSKPKDEFQLAAAKMRGEFIPPTGTLEEQAKAVDGTDSYMGMTVPKAKTYAGKQEVKKEFEKQQEIAASAFDEQAKGTADFNRALSNVNKEMMDFDEEDITPKLQGLFGLYGYKFDYATDAREAVEVTAPNGKKKTIPVDAFTEAGDIESANEFKSFINANKPTLRQTTEQPFYQDRNYNRILNEEEAKQQMANINKITERQDRLESDLKALSINKEKLTRELNKSVIGSPEYLKREEQLNQLDNYIAETNKELDYFNKRDKPLKEKLKASMGSYAKAAAEQGGLLAASYNAALSASGGILAGLNDMVGFLSSRMMEDATTEEKDASYQMVKKRSPIIRESLLKAYGITSVSEEYLAAAQEDFLKRNVLGAAAFVPQLAGMAAAPEVAIPLFFLGGYDGTMEKMDNNPKFKNVSEAEKFGVATTAGIINTVLMKYNVGEKVLESAKGKILMGGILKRIGSKTGATTIEEVVDNEVKGAISKGLITVAAGASHGFSLGAQIKVGEIVSEELYNKMKEEKLFDTPEDFTQAFHQVMESGLDMAMGSVLLGVPKTFQKSLKENNYQGITSEDLDVLNAYANSSEFLEFKKAQVGQKVASREITKEQGVQEIAALETNISIYKSIPENLSDAGKRKAMGLLSEKRQLDSFIQGKDKALVKKQIDRVAEINKQLEALPDMKEEVPATPEAATPSYSINGKEMSEQEFTKAVSEMSPEDVKKADIKANNATEGVTTLLKEVATRSGVESAPMMETTAPAEAPTTLEQELREKLDYDFYEERLNSEYEWERERAKEFLADPKAFFEKNIETAKTNLENDPNNVISKNVLDDSTERLKIFNEITNKYKENAVQEPTTEEGVLRTEQPEVGLPKMGEGNAQETTTQEGVTPAKPQEVKPQEGSVGEALTDEALIERRAKNRNIIDAEGSTYWADISFNNTKIGDEIHYTDNKGVQHKTKVKDVVDGEFVFENGQTRDDVSSYMNITAEDAWFAKNKPTEAAPAKPTEAKPIEQELAELEQMFPTEGPTGENKGVAASDTKAMEEIASRSTDERVQKVVRTAQKLTKTLKSLFPNAEINIHETEESYNGAMEEINATKESNGNFAFGVVDGKPFVRIDINANTASSRDVAHEVAHAVLVKTFGDNQKLFQSFQEKIAKVISTDSNQKLLDFANNPKYKEQGVTYEEYMAELKAILSEEGAKIELSTAKKIAAVINEYVSKITKGAFKPFQEVTDVKQVVDFVNKVTEAMAKGEAIDVEAAGKMGEGSRSSLREGALKDVESTTKALEPLVNEKKSSIGVQLRKLVGLIAHNGSESITKFDPTKIKGQTRGRYGKGFYFSSLFKNFDYGDKSTFLNSNKLNLLNGDMYVSDVIYRLSSPTEINARINKFKELLSKSKNSREYNEILEEINILEEERSSFDENSKYIEKALEKAVQEKPKEQFSSFLENLESRVIESNRLNPSRAVQGLNESLNNLLLKSGFDGVSFTEGNEILIIPQEKLNDLIIASQEKAISEAYHKAKEDGSNPKLVKAVEDLLGAGEITSRSSLRTAEQVDKMVKDARASGYSEKAIEEFLKKRGVDQAIVDKSLGKKEAGTKIVTNEEMMPGYDKVMEDVNSEILRGLDRKTKETTIEKNVMKIVEGSEAYKNATDQQRNQMVRDVKEAFGEKMKQAPSAEKITGKEQKKVTVDVAQALKDQIKLEVKAALEGAKSVTEKIKAVKDYFDSVKDFGNLTRKDLTRVMDVIAKVKDEKTLDKAVNKINDIIDKATSDKIEISEKKMIANTIKEVKLAKGNIKEKRKLITDVIDSIKKSGKLTAAQVNALLKRANNLNVESFEHLNKFIDYAEKLFADADYDNKLSKGSGLRESIKNLSKNKSNNYNGSLVKLGEEFIKIDPSLVEDIEQYNKIASDLKDAIKGSSTKGFKPTVEIKAVDAYVEEMMKSQKEKITESTREQIEKLLGVDGSKFTYDEMMELIQESKEKGAKEKQKLSEENEKTVRTTAVKWFESLSSTIDHILKTGKDPFTGEPVNIKESKKDVIKRFMEMDLTKMDIKDAVRAVDALDNFIVNQSTAKMERVLSKYKAKRNMEMLIKNKITSSVLKIFRSGRIGRGLLREFGSETVLMDALFKGTGKAEIVAKAIGLSDYKSNVSKAKTVVRNMVADYVVEFYKKKANGEDFNTAFNNAERGMLAFVSRTKIGKEEASFKDRKSLVKQSIESLKNGNEKEIEKSKLYQDVYDKILKDSKSLDDVKSKADDINSKAVDFWIEKWSENYEELADVSENIHNVILGRFGNYTPDVVRRVKEYTDKETKEEDMLDLEGSAFLNNSGIVQKKSGRLEKVTVEDTLPEGSYYDFGFDNNNSSLMSDALIDAKTAGNVIELSTFLNSPEFKKIVTTSEERGVLKDVMSGIVRSVRGKEKYNYNEISSLVKSFNRASALGASYVLGGVAAIPKQYLVPAVNTMIASGGYRPHFDIWWNKSKQDFVNNSGESVANRGVMSNADIKNIDNLLQEAAKSTPEKALRLIEKVNKVYLKNFLVNRDVAIAKASWLTYYEKSLRKQGKFETVEKTITPSGVIEVKTKGIDYSKHEINREAAQYATRMVDRQQNISDEDFRGRFYSNKEGLGPIVTKVLLPFASFRINQWLRMNTDLGILVNKTTTYEDRLEASKSLAAAGVEIAFFNAIGLGISSGLHSAATATKRYFTGEGDEEDKEKLKDQDDKYWKNLLKSKGSAVVQDFLSPLPPFDPLFESLVYNTLDKLQSDTKEEDRINIYEPKPKEVEGWLEYVAKNTGGAGILADRALKFKEIADAYLNEKIETTNYGETTEKNIRERDKKALGVLTTLAFVNMLGIFPTEVYNAQNTAFKEIVKAASTQTEAEIIQEKAKKRDRRADNIEKIQVINRAINVATDQAVVNELMKMRKETRDELFPQKMSDEAKEVMKRKREREKASYKGLLGGYDTKTDLKRYNPDLYEQNFGENSEYGQTHKAEVKADKLFDAMMKKTKDEKYGYTPTTKKKSKKRKKNSDGTYKSSYFRSSSR